MLSNAPIHGSSFATETQVDLFSVEFGSNLSTLLNIFDAVISELFLFSSFSSKESFRCNYCKSLWDEEVARLCSCYLDDGSLYSYSCNTFEELDGDSIISHRTLVK